MGKRYFSMETVSAQSRKKERAMDFEDLAKVSVDDIIVGNPIPADGCHQYYLLTDKFQPGCIRNYLFDDDMIITIVKEQDQCVANGFLIDSAKERILVWFEVENDVIKSIKKFELKKFVVDVSETGDRWEGEMDALSDTILGYGTLYNAENTIIYQGFRFSSHHIGYGHYFYPDTKRIHYSGMIGDYDYFGKGKLYDRKGDLIHEGIFMKSVCTIQEANIPLFIQQVLSNQCQKLFFDHAYHIPQVLLDFSVLPYLQAFIATSSVLYYSPTLRFTNHECIQTFQIKTEVDIDCFNPLIGKYIYYPCLLDQNGLFFQNCPNLQSIQIEDSCCHQYKNLHVNNCGSLTLISIGKNNFSCIDSECSITSI